MERKRWLTHLHVSKCTKVTIKLTHHHTQVSDSSNWMGGDAINRAGSPGGGLRLQWGWCGDSKDSAEYVEYEGTLTHLWDKKKQLGIRLRKANWTGDDHVRVLAALGLATRWYQKSKKSGALSNSSILLNCLHHTCRPLTHEVSPCSRCTIFVPLSDGLLPFSNSYLWLTHLLCSLYSFQK